MGGRRLGVAEIDQDHVSPLAGFDGADLSPHSHRVGTVDRRHPRGPVRPSGPTGRPPAPDAPAPGSSCPRAGSQIRCSSRHRYPRRASPRPSSSCRSSSVHGRAGPPVPAMARALTLGDTVASPMYMWHHQVRNYPARPMTTAPLGELIRRKKMARMTAGEAFVETLAVQGGDRRVRHRRFRLHGSTRHLRAGRNQVLAGRP